MPPSSVFIFAPIAIFLLSSPGPVILAQTIKLVAPPYLETFVGNPEVSGSLLVGVAAGAPTGAFDPNAVAVSLSAELRGRKACVEVASRDGRYSAENLYQLPDGSGTAFLETQTKYIQQLSRYDAKEIAVTIRLVDDCNSPKQGLIVPALLQLKASEHQPDAGRAGRRRLVIFVNKDKESLMVSLLKSGAEVARATCNSEPNSVNIAFTSSCSVVADLAPGGYALLIRVHERFSSRDSRFEVLLP
jgi:hypothetical protein